MNLRNMHATDLLACLRELAGRIHDIQRGNYLLIDYHYLAFEHSC